MKQLPETQTIVTPGKRRRRGPWGTTRRDERLYGYPPPRNDRYADLEERVELLERMIGWTDAPFVE